MRPSIVEHVGKQTGKLAGSAKSLVLVVVPAPFVTAIDPVNAPTGTAVVICVSDTKLKVAEVPVGFAAVTPNATAVTPVKLVPESVTGVPTDPLTGRKLVPVNVGRASKALRSCDPFERAAKRASATAKSLK
jgi:hypothetical protein